ncbi:MAG TPA: hypothetical protein VNM34_14895 [Verrucomicrobiae bacterium]|nr:hypothetical protein [Verrucomicrobiae bacterium]
MRLAPCRVCGRAPEFDASEYDTRTAGCRAVVRLSCFASPEDFDPDDSPLPVHDVAVHARNRTRAAELWNRAFGGKLERP